MFYAGVVVPMIFPQVYPLMGVLFWTLVACLQYLVGYKNTQLQKHLGWKQTEAPEADESNRESGENEAEGLASHEIPAEQGVVEDNAIETVEETIEEAPQSPDDEETIEEAPQSPDDVEIPPTPFLHVAAPAKSVPTVNPDEQQQQSDAIWRNCNSETECKGRENTRGTTISFENIKRDRRNDSGTVRRDTGLEPGSSPASRFTSTVPIHPV